ncbi:MAG: hypothetical protein QOH30_340 [Baekduia sp.]|jgi:hypothetical protein|nr:hypothetical protein [Conexibacter sp.]MDX6713782.1 hypothetical protein [Baekduia sp.]
MDARTVARLYAVGRAGLGAALLVAPSRLGRPWIGAVADQPGGQVALRGLGIRDLLLGGIALHVADRPGVGPRTMMTCAIADAVDAGATLAARRHLPPGAAGVVALAAGGAATGFWLRAALPS